MPHLKTRSLLFQVEEEIRIPSPSRAYLVSVMEKVLLAEEGCFPLLPPMRELRAACHHAKSFSKSRVPCVEETLRHCGRVIRVLVIQRKVASMEAFVVSSRRRLPFLSRTRNPPALRSAKSSSSPNKEHSYSTCKLVSPPLS